MRAIQFSKEGARTAAHGDTVPLDALSPRLHRKNARCSALEADFCGREWSVDRMRRGQSVAARGCAHEAQPEDIGGCAGLEGVSGHTIDGDETVRGHGIVPHPHAIPKAKLPVVAGLRSDGQTRFYARGVVQIGVTCQKAIPVIRIGGIAPAIARMAFPWP